jgi:NADPH:quinone reductase-like Zn-dependent oxidoreductase
VGQRGVPIHPLTGRDRVAGVIPSMALGPRAGTLAEFVGLPASAFTRVPAGVDNEEAAVVGLAGIAAHDALEALNLQSGETVLVFGATDAVGCIAVQLAAQTADTIIRTVRWRGGPARPRSRCDAPRRLGR